MPTLKLTYILLSGFLSIGCDNGQSEAPLKNLTDSTTHLIDSTNINILFIGNSLTYSNDLPSLVKKEAASNGITISTKMIAYGNYAIIDHWHDGKVQEEIGTKKYDFVVIQQGPSSQAYGREVLLEYGAKFKSLCEENQTQLAFFMVWPSRTYYHTFNGVIKNYTDAATLTNSILCPVGSVWKELDLQQ